MADGPGTVWAERYELVRRIGSGGMGTVWAARDLVLERPVAIKRLHVAGEDGGRRFLREARLGASLRHPGLVPVYDLVEEPDTVLLVMELVEGESLADRLERGPLPPPETLAAVRDVAAALDHAHAAGVVHRDVKPANILLGQDGRARLADLGIASAADASQITAPGALLGSARYLAPELLDGAAATPASDVYALAAVAFESLSGRPANGGSGSIVILQRIRTAEVPDLRAAWPEATPEAAAVLAQGLARDPGERPATGRDLVESLGAALEARPGDPAPATEEHVRAAPAPADMRPPAPASARTPAPPAPRQAAARGRRSAAPRRALAALAVLVTAGALAAVLLGGGDSADEDPPSRAGQEPAPTEPTPAGDASDEEAPAEDATPAAPTAKGTTPEDAVRNFYGLAAAGDFDGAWRLAGPGMRRAFGSRTELARQLASLESVEFEELSVSEAGERSATVTVRTVARHETRTDRCRGTLSAVRGARGGWRVDPSGISCQAAPG